MSKWFCHCCVQNCFCPESEWVWKYKWVCKIYHNHLGLVFFFHKVEKITLSIKVITTVQPSPTLSFGLIPSLCIHSQAKKD